MHHPCRCAFKAEHTTKCGESMHECSAERTQEICAAQKASRKGAGISTCSGKRISGEGFPRGNVRTSRERHSNHDLLAWTLIIMQSPHAECRSKNALMRSRGSAEAGMNQLLHSCRCLQHCVTQTFQCLGRCALPQTRPSLARPSMSWSMCRSALKSLNFLLEGLQS